MKEFKRHLVKALTVLLVAAALTGCMKVRITYDVEKSGKTTAGMTFLMSKGMMDMMQVKPDELVKQVEDSYKDDETFKGKVTAAKEKVGDEEYYGYTVTGLDSELQAKVEDGLIVLEIPVADLIAATVESFSDFDQSLENISLSDFEMEIVVNMPNKATCNYGVVDGKKVTINVADIPQGTKTVVVSCPKGSILPWLIVGILALVVLAAWYLMKNKKSGTANETLAVKEVPVEEVPVEEMPVEETPAEEVVEETPVEEIVKETTEEVTGPIADAAEETAETVQDTADENIPEETDKEKK
ncbi:MAG: hypothetical protein IJJ30_02105 [Erysipelotrichaceae bacterium]|nr:hypothetical protein [Erysipelotrichaceae bacterium]